jgi:PAS domain S-box-containing protein
MLSHNYIVQEGVNSMEKYYGIFENYHIPMLIIDDKTGRIVDANTAACIYYGYDKKEMIKLNISDINTKDIKELFGEMEKAKSGERKIFRFKHKLSNGNLREVEVYSGPVQLEEKSLLFSVVHDIKEKNEFEERFRKQKSYFEDLFENSPEAIAILDNEFRIVNVNKSFEEMFLYKIDEIMDENITNIMCNEKYYSESTYLQEGIRKGDFIRIETLRKRKDGKLIDVSIMGFPIRSNGEQIGVYFIYSDLRRVKEEERKFKVSVERYVNLLKNTIDSIPDIIAVLNSDLTVELINEAGCSYLNVLPDKFKGMEWSKIVEAFTGEDDDCAAITIKTKEPYHIEKYIKAVDRFVDWYCRPVLDNDNEVILIVERIKDITNDKKHEAMLRYSKEKAEEASRLKTQFLANMSHEIRTPISGVIGIIDMIKDTALEDEQKEYIGMLKYSADRLLSIVNDILDISKIEAGKLELRNEQFSMNKLLDKLINYFQILSKNKGLEFVASIDKHIPNIVIGDSGRLNQILFNLLGNAVKFTDTGFISLSAKLIKYIDEHVQIEFCISDTGIGIQKQMIENLFMNFTQLNHGNNKRYGGTGLGLALSQKLVELMGGKISAESQYNIGSTFKFCVKINTVGYFDKVSEITQVENENRDLKLPERLRVLVAEDEIINQKIIKNILSKGGCSTTIVSNGREVLKALEVQKFDILLLDMCMPVIDGYEVTKNIREKEKRTGEHIPIIAISAVVIKEEVDRCFSLGIDEYIVKPVRKNEIFKAILKLINGRHKCLNFNLKGLIGRLEGNNELLKEIIDEVISEKYENEFLGCMERYIEEKDYERLNKHVHKFEGSLSHFEIKSINDIFKSIKNDIKSQEIQDIHKSLDYLRYEFLKLKENLIFYKEKY